jgi:plastocyanin
MKKFYSLILTVCLLFIGHVMFSITHIVTQTNNSFNPQTLAVQVGDVVRWVWTSGSHTTTSASVPAGASPWNSPLTSGTSQFEYTVLVAGTYDYVCTPHAGMGMNGSFTAVPAVPACAVNPTVTQEENNVTVSINGSGAANPLYSIDWGDGSNSANLPTSSHLYTEPGTYEICVTYVDQNNPSGCMVHNCDLSVVIEDTGTPECSVELTVVVNGNSVVATAVGTGLPVAPYTLHWGDGATSEGSIGTHIYSEPGDYTVCVGYGSILPGSCFAEDCEEITIEDTGSNDCNLTMSVSNVDGLVITIVFEGTGAELPQYEVDWGDGTVGSGEATATHSYESEGVYDICVTYSDANSESCTVEECTTVTVSEQGAECTVTLTVTNVGNTYTASAVGTGAAQPQFAIDWGDESIPVLSNSGVQTYTTEGEFEICAVYMDLVNSENCLVADCETVNVIILSVEEQSDWMYGISIFPNPVSESTMLEFTLALPSLVNIEIIDVLGKSVQSVYSGTLPQGPQRISYDTRSLSNGVYFVRMQSGSEQTHVRMLKR